MTLLAGAQMQVYADSVYRHGTVVAMNATSPGGSGAPSRSHDDRVRMVGALNRQCYQVAIHANGDGRNGSSR